MIDYWVRERDTGEYIPIDHRSTILLNSRQISIPTSGELIGEIWIAAGQIHQFIYDPPISFEPIE